MRIIATVMTILSFLSVMLTMHAGLKAGHGQEFFVSHLTWAFISVAVLALTLTLCLLFVFKMHSIIHDLVNQLDAKGGI